MQVVRRGIPDFVTGIKADHDAQLAHVFVLDGNIEDYCDNAGNDLPVKKVIASVFDDNIKRDLNPDAGTSHADAGLQSARRVSEKLNVVAFYNSSTGLEFADDRGFRAWQEFIAQVKYAENPDDDTWAPKEAGDSSPYGPARFFAPQSPDVMIGLMNEWFRISGKIFDENRLALRMNPETARLKKEVCLTIVFMDADTLFPAGDLANLRNDRLPVVTVRNWARDQKIGARNRIILMAKHRSAIHESIRSELAISHTIRKPNLQDRTEWITNFDANIRAVVRQTGQPWSIGSNRNIEAINLAQDFTLEEFARQAAGMSRRQIKDVILTSWRTSTPLDFPMVQERKKRALEDEYGGMIDIKEPSFGFDAIGGHEHFKDYCVRKIIRPLRSGNVRQCSRGVIQTGPPGTGKSTAAWALAGEANVNFIEVNFGKVFGGLVGESERKMRELIEALWAASPCVVFGDELDSVFSSGRQSGGDSGTAARVFNSWMTFLSDPSRVGKIVFIGATNRPDLLDAALIRPGRVDAKIPMLAPFLGDAVGRWDILTAQTRKHKIKLSEELAATRNNSKSGLGRLLYDDKRIWTGAEMEQLLQAAYDEAVFADRKLNGKDDHRVTLEDWNAAIDDVIPNTEEVERMTNLALLYVDRLKYVPEAWRERAKDKKALKAALGMAV